MNEKISIIVPVYNAEKYINRCIRSIIDQTYKNLEIIIIDDGSTDNSPSMCDEFAEFDNRIKSIHIQNQGVSFARNIGIKLASGNYIGFVDSDDYINARMYEDLYENIKKTDCDISICGITKELIRKGKITSRISSFIPSKVYSIKEYIDLFNITFGNGFGAIWNKLYKKSLIIDNNIWFNNSIHMNEDIIFNLDILMKTNRIAVVNKPYYHYTHTNPDSATAKKRNNYNSYKRTYLYSMSFLKKYNAYEKHKIFLDNYHVDEIISCFVNLYYLYDRKQFFEQYFKLLDDNNLKKKFETAVGYSRYKKAIIYMVKKEHHNLVYMILWLRVYAEKFL